MKKLVLLCACLSIAIGVNAQTNTRKAKKDESLRTISTLKHDTLFVTKDKVSQLPQLVDKDRQNKYLIIERGETIKKNLATSSFETTAKSTEELSKKLDFYKQNGFSVKNISEKENTYYISFEKK